MAEDTTGELGRALKDARNAGGVRQVDVAGRVEDGKVVSQARLSRIENGTSLATEEEVVELARRYSADRDTTAKLVKLVKAARAGVRDSRLVVQRGNTLALQQRWRALEENAVTVRAYHPVLVLGNLQTARYAAIATGQAADSDVVTERLRRRERYTAQGRRSVLIQTEGALRQVVGSPEIMVEQLDAIDQASRQPSVEFGVIPAERAMPFLVVGGFNLYDDTAAVVGLQVAAATLTEPADVQYFLGLFDRLAELAAWGDDAREVLEHVRFEHARAE